MPRFHAPQLASFLSRWDRTLGSRRGKAAQLARQSRTHAGAFRSMAGASMACHRRVLLSHWSWRLVTATSALR